MYGQAALAGRDARARPRAVAASERRGGQTPTVVQRWRAAARYGSAAGLVRRARAASNLARVRSAGLLHAQSRPGAAARAAAQRGLGRAGLEPIAHVGGPHSLVAPEGRARPGAADLHPDGAADRVSV